MMMRRRPEGAGTAGCLAAWMCGGVVMAAAYGNSVALAAETESSRLNVVLISLDTVRPDHLGCYGYRRKTSPQIDRIAAEGTVFTHAFSQAPQTLASHLSFMTSQYPEKAWIAWEALKKEEAFPESLPVLLKRAGYTTVGYLGFTDLFPFHRDVLAYPPFQMFDRRTLYTMFRTLSPDVFHWLARERQEPFLLFVHGFDAHEPHLLPIEFNAKRFNPAYHGPLFSSYEGALQQAMAETGVQPTRPEEEYGLIEMAFKRLLNGAGPMPPETLHHLHALYDAQISYLDEGLGRLFTALSNLDLMDRTLIVILSDHGQSFGEHGRYAEHLQCYDEVLRMALIVRDPRRRGQGRRIDELVQGVDVLPTILDLLDLPVPPTVVGKSLRPFLADGRHPGREAHAVSVWKGVRTLRTPQWKLFSRGGIPDELYRVANDPTEQRNVLVRHPIEALRLQRQLDAIVPASAEAPPETVEAAQHIRAHGYW